MCALLQLCIDNHCGRTPKSVRSGAPTVAWVEFPLNTFHWDGTRKPGLFQSSENTQRCFCQNCGGLLGTLNKGYPNVCITIASLKNPSLIVPDEKHSYIESAPSWWKPNILKLRKETI